MIKHPSPVPTRASVHAVWLVQLAPEELVSPSARSSSPLLAPAGLLLHGDLQGEHGGDQEAAQRQGSLHLRVWTLDFAGTEGGDRLTFVALIRGFYTEGDLQ